MGRKKAKLRKKVRVILVLFLLVALALVAVWLVLRVNRGTISTGSMEFRQENIESVIIREERVESGASYGRITYIADEGQDVQSGQVVAQVYKSGYNENALLELVTLQQKIKKYQVDTLRKDISDPEYNAIQAQIDTKLFQISQEIDSSSRSTILQLQRELVGLLKQRQEYLAQFQPDGALTQLMESEKEYLQLMEQWQDDITAGGAGKISFAFDDYTFLNDTILKEGKLSYSDIQAVRQNKKPEISVLDTARERALYRLVSPERFYCVISSSAKNYFSMVLGETYALEFNGFYDKTYEGEVVDVWSSSSGHVYVLKVEEDVTPFFHVRTARVTVSAEFSRLSVPTDAVAAVDNVRGIYIEQNGRRVFVAIDILAQNKSETIFKVSDPEGIQLMPGVGYVSKNIG